jgi:uncharacterized iron-regulated protein
MFGEQHDQVDQQRQVADSVRALAAEARLAAVVLEMAERGRGTAALPADADDSVVRAALGWNEAGWPWGQYGPIVMAAVRAGVPVWGGNLPRAAMKQAMADASLDGHLGPAGRARLSKAISDGHCGLLPEQQVPGMLRIQIARDLSMAEVIGEQLVSPAARGRKVLLLAGEQHASRDTGVPWHLRHTRGLPASAIRVVVFGDPAEGGPLADEHRPAARTPRADPCEGLRQRLGPAPAASAAG